MKKRILGRTGIEVTELGLGGVFVSSWGGAYDQARNVINRALELGVNYFDTAPGYGNSEEVIGKVLENIKAPIVFSTKLGGRPLPFDPKDKNGLRKSIEESLRLLKRDYIDILMIHEPDRPEQYDWWSDTVELHGPVLELLDDLKKEGIIGYTGLGGTTAYEMATLIRTGKFDVVLTAFNYSLLWREAEYELLPSARENKMGIVIGSPLQQGALARRYDKEIKQGAPWMSSPRRSQYCALYDFLDEIDISISELALRFVISNPDISTVLTGARSEHEVDMNMEAVNKGPLSTDIMKQLDRIAAMVPFRPFEEPFGLPFGGKRSGPGGAR